ncbi:MAG: regulatory protein RecX [Deltaproteobacteria bacterium]|nr:regulatory protein RecX [Deltaproteobacteria bacterium]
MRDRLSPPRPAERSPTPLDYAYRLLAQRSYSEVQLADKMLAKGFTEAVVARTVARLKEQGYLNDVRLAADQVERLRQHGFGRARIRATLAQQGIATDTLTDALTSTSSDDEREDAKRFLASRFSADALKQPKIAARAFRLLLSRGYPQDVVEQLLGSGLDGTRYPEEE